MGRGSSKAGSGGSAGKEKVTALMVYKEDARQFNEAKAKAKEENAGILEYTDHTGKTYRSYWDGVKWTDRPNSLYESLNNNKYKKKGTYKAKYKKPKGW